MSANGKKKKCPKRGRRFSQVEIAEILKAAVDSTVEDVAAGHGCTERSIYRWQKLYPELVDGRGVGEVDVTGPPTNEPSEPKDGSDSQAPVPSGGRLTPADDLVRRRVLEIKQDNPSYGPAQIQAYLRRFDGLRVCIKIVSNILVEAGYPLQKRKAKEPDAPLRFEMTRPNEMWQIDILQFRVIEQTVYLLHAIDDFSRFSVGHRLLTSVRAEDVVSMVHEAVQRHGKPEALLSDRGPQFSAFRGMTAFERWLEQQLIDHPKARAYHPQTMGKLEALNSTIREELIDQHEFITVAETREHFARWFTRYCFQRPHLGIGGLTPADRYFGRAAQVREQIARAIAAGGRDLRDEILVGDRATRQDCTILQLRLVQDQLELWFAGKKVRLG